MSKIDKQLRRIVVREAKQAGSVNALCKAAQVPQASVSDWLAEKGGLSWSVVCRLCDHLGVGLGSPVADPQSRGAR